MIVEQGQDGYAANVASAPEFIKSWNAFAVHTRTESMKRNHIIINKGNNLKKRHTRRETKHMKRGDKVEPHIDKRAHEIAHPRHLLQNK